MVVLYFIAGAVLNVIVTVVRSPGLLQDSPHPYQGLAASAAVGAVIYGTVFWLVSLLF